MYTDMNSLSLLTDIVAVIVSLVNYNCILLEYFQKNVLHKLGYILKVLYACLNLFGQL